jgi:hypothetical protein
MNETSVKDLLRQAMAGDEPPVSPQIVGGAVRAARSARRRQVAGAIVAVAAIAPGLAFGVPAIAHALAPPAAGQHGYVLTPAADSGSSHAKKYDRVRSTPKRAKKGQPPPASNAPKKSRSGSSQYTFLQPKQLIPANEVNPVPITSQSVGQLLLDDLPAAAQPSQIEANANANPSAATQVAMAWLEDVKSALGSGEVQATVMGVGSTPFDFGCGSGKPDGSCRAYDLPGGVKVAESYSTNNASGRWVMLMVSVFRPNVAEFNVSETNSAMAAGSPVSKAMPLTLSQMLRIALDSRWQLTISQSFVQQASGLQVAPLDTAGS